MQMAGQVAPYAIGRPVLSDIGVGEHQLCIGRALRGIITSYELLVSPKILNNTHLNTLLLEPIHWANQQSESLVFFSVDWS